MWKKLVLSIAGAAMAVAAAGFAYLHLRQPDSLPAASIQVPMTPEAIARGEYLFTVIADCDGCHSQRDFSRFAAPVVPAGRGRGFLFPPEFGLPGKVAAPNITPDVETGIGAWTDGEKIRAIREGIRRDGAALFNMMPYENYRHMSDADVHALVAYLNSLPPVRNQVPRSELDFPVGLLIKS
jgi:mono/diheme cytochrome c family protein